MIYYDMEKFFERKADIAARDEQGIVKDKIYFACFKNTLLHSFSPSQIKTAIKNNWIKESHIEDQNKSFRTVYLWLDTELKQRRLLPSLIESFTSFVNKYIALPFMRLFEKD